MASTVNKSIEELVSCVLCHDVFEDPRILPCSHTYCRQCIAEHASVNGDRFSCPLRDGCGVAANQIKSLPVDRHVLGLVELHRK